MGRAKISRKTTNIDMTAMCDVAFLLLTFFMLSTKFKPEEAVPIKTPNSVSSDIVPDKDAFLVSVDKTGKTFFTYDNEEIKRKLIEKVSADKGFTLTEVQKRNFVKSVGIGVPLAKLSSFLAYAPDQAAKLNIEGIPVQDTANNELQYWVQALVSVNDNKKPENVLLKTDGDTKYPVFKNVIGAFKKNGILKFKLVTTPEAAPVGTDLFNKMNTGKK
jgi:biopolymer transport protein ExbD